MRTQGSQGVGTKAGACSRLPDSHKGRERYWGAEKGCLAARAKGEPQGGSGLFRKGGQEGREERSPAHWQHRRW